MEKVSPMSDIGRCVSDKNGAQYVKEVLAFIENEQNQLLTKMRKGLAKQEYENAKAKVRAWNSAKLILKSIHLYHVG